MARIRPKTMKRKNRPKKRPKIPKPKPKGCHP
jgi:hypothetical protein